MNRPSPRVILICVGLFLFFLLLQFPFKNFRGKIFESVYRQSGVLVTADDMGINLFGWPGISLRNVTIDVQQLMFSLSAESAVIRVGIGSLFPPSPSISASLDDLSTGGDLWFRFAEGDPMRLGLEADGVGCETISFYGQPPPVLGKLSADVDLAISPANLAASTGYIKMKGDDLAIAPLNVPGWIQLAEATRVGPGNIVINVQGGVAEIAAFELGKQGSELHLKLSGNARLGANLDATRLDIRLDIGMSPEFASSPQGTSLKGYLGLYEISGQRYAMQWNTTIGEMQRNPLAALPQKIPK